jgi:hypothetical protein
MGVGECGRCCGDALGAYPPQILVTAYNSILFLEILMATCGPGRASDSKARRIIELRLSGTCPTDPQARYGKCSRKVLQTSSTQFADQARTF